MESKDPLYTPLILELLNTALICVRYQWGHYGKQGFLDTGNHRPDLQSLTTAPTLAGGDIKAALMVVHYLSILICRGDQSYLI